jgi:hypothetical protein
MSAKCSSLANINSPKKFEDFHLGLSLFTKCDQKEINESYILALFTSQDASLISKALK